MNETESPSSTTDESNHHKNDYPLSTLERKIILFLASRELYEAHNCGIPLSDLVTVMRRTHYVCSMAVSKLERLGILAFRRFGRRTTPTANATTLYVTLLTKQYNSVHTAIGELGNTEPEQQNDGDGDAQGNDTPDRDEAKVKDENECKVSDSTEDNTTRAPVIDDPLKDSFYSTNWIARPEESIFNKNWGIPSWQLGDNVTV